MSKTAKTMKWFILITLIINTITAATITSATFVEMEKTHSPIKVSYNCGEILEFNITLTVRTVKDGPILSIKNLQIKDTLPTGLSFLPGNRTSTPTAIGFTNYHNGTLLWDFGAGPFLDEPQATLRFNVTVTHDAPEGVFITNRATAFYEETVSGAHSSPTVTDVIRVIYPILDIDKVCTGTIHEGEGIVYTVTLRNTGNHNATSLTVTDFLPSGVVYTPGSATATSGIIDESMLPGNLMWKGEIGNITGVHTVNITIPVTDKPAVISSTIMNNVSYTEIIGCEAMVKWWDTCETPVIHPEITITKECATSFQIEPANITYTYTVTNTGDVPLSDVYVYDETHTSLILGPITLDPMESDGSTMEILNQPMGTYIDTANATGYDFLGLRVEDHDTAQCTIRGESPPVGGEIYPAVTYEQRLILGSIVILCAAVFWRIKK
jgi:uncharacterized repeat protein (TIGR01451 family)